MYKKYPMRVGMYNALRTLCSLLGPAYVAGPRPIEESMISQLTVLCMSDFALKNIYVLKQVCVNTGDLFRPTTQNIH